ncbi:hypothetical protein CALVIDRAFT_457637, partial [Calocera viscosa TUFC12733]
MPELPEAERATRLLRSAVVGGRITRVETVEDALVFEGLGEGEFARELTGRTILSAHRHGKLFWLQLSPPTPAPTPDHASDADTPTPGGRHPVFHLGMTGMIHLKGGEGAYYWRVRPKDLDKMWPPRFWKFIMHVLPAPSTSGREEEEVQLAFLDARRLSRVRLRLSPATEPPVSLLGFDALTPPPLSTFSPLLLKRNMPIKALLLDQSFSAGVGNWVADEVLFQARVHPERRASGLGEEEVERVWSMIREVCERAVEVNADSEKFPEGWLFRHRWGKGKDVQPLLLEDGREGTIRWTTVGGRTSAWVEEVQVL